MRFFEFGGGLGDVFHTVFTTNQYASLERLRQKEQVTVILTSHNPHAKELFEWHRNRLQMIVKNLGYWLPQDDKKNRILYGIPPHQPAERINPSPMVFYSSPSDKKILDQLKQVGRYIVFSTAAGTEPSRDLPEALRLDAVAAAIAWGYKVVVVGKNYKLFDRAEHRFENHPEVINLIDLLSVPGAILATQGSSAVITCHSALCILSWHLKKPTFVAYPKHTRERHFTGSDEHAFGKDRPTTVHIEFSEYSKNKLEQFFDIVS